MPKAPRASLVPSRRPNPMPPKGTSSKPLKAIFRGLTMSFSGIFYSNDKILPHEKIAGWITHHGGKWVREVGEGTTHLICSVEDYRRKTSQVQKAWSLGKSKCSIVVLEWIEDSLLGPHGTKRLRAERGYTLDRTLARIKKGRTDHEKFRARFEEGVRIARDLCDSSLHHVYCDSTSFEYKVVLTRINFNNKIPMERFTLFLFESHALPATYMTGAKFSRSHRPLAYYRDTCIPKDFSSAFADFKRFFQLKTGIEWDARLEPVNTKAPEAFTYKPPVLGRPVGVLPWGYVRPEMCEEEKVVEEGKRVGKDVVYDTDSEVDDEEEVEDDEETVEENIRREAEYVVEDRTQTQLESLPQSRTQTFDLPALGSNDNSNLDAMVIRAASQSILNPSTSFSVPASSQETDLGFSQTKTQGTSFSSVNDSNQSFSSDPSAQNNQLQHNYPPYPLILPIPPFPNDQDQSPYPPPPTFPLFYSQPFSHDFTCSTTTNSTVFTPFGALYTSQTSTSLYVPTSANIFIPADSPYTQTGGGGEGEDDLDMNDIPDDEEKGKRKGKALPELNGKGKKDRKAATEEPISMEKGINREKYALEMARGMASKAARLRGQMKGVREGVYAGLGKVL